MLWETGNRAPALRTHFPGRDKPIVLNMVARDASPGVRKDVSSGGGIQDLPERSSTSGPTPSAIGNGEPGKGVIDPVLLLRP
jgi:hypothetical protein